MIKARASGSKDYLYFKGQAGETQHSAEFLLEGYKFSSANFQKMLRPSYIILRIQRRVGKQCRSR